LLERAAVAVAAVKAPVAVEEGLQMLQQTILTLTK
jgi:hypothetical protein